MKHLDLFSGISNIKRYNDAMTHNANLFEDKLYKIISKSIKNYEKNFSDEELTALTGDFIYLKSRKDPKYLHQWIDMCTEKIKELDNKIYDALLKMRKEIMDAYKFEDLEKIYMKSKKKGY